MSLKLLGTLPSRLADSGWTVHLVSPGIHIDDSNHRRIHHHNVGIERNPKIGSDILSLVVLVRLLRSLKPAVVVGATPKASFLSALAGFLVRTPSRVYFIWGLRLETASGIHRKALWVLENLTAKFSTHLIAVSPSLRDAYRRERLGGNRRIEVLGHGSSKGVALQTFRPAFSFETRELEEEFVKIGLVPGIPVIGYFGRLAKDKGLEFLAASRKILATQNVDHQVLAVGAEETQGESIRKLNEAGRPVVHLGPVNDTSRFYRMVDILCLPTLREGMPNVCLEAAASGVPVVTTNVTGAVDSVLPGVTGLVVESGSAEALALALRSVISDPALIRKLSSSSRPWVECHFDEKVVVKTYLDYLEKLRDPSLSSARKHGQR